jgi:hypothetical protein
MTAGSTALDESRPTLADTIASALRLAERGLDAFPAGALVKTPLHAGWQAEATCDRNRLARLLTSAWPCNLAIATGQRSGAWVLDLDNKGAVDGFATLIELEFLNGELPRSWTTATPSRGEHRWFAPPTDGRRIGCGAGALAGRGIDVRGEGGLVIVPPGRTPVGAYRWIVAPWEAPLAQAPGWLIDLIHSRAVAKDADGKRLFKSAEGLLEAWGSPAEALRRLTMMVAIAASGGRNHALNKSAFHAAEWVQGGLISRWAVETALRAAGVECGLDDDEIVKTLASAFRGVTS